MDLYNMRLKLIVLLICSILQVGCASLWGVQNSKFTSEKIEIGMSKSDFLALVGDPYAKEMKMDNRHNRPLERLLYQESIYDREWYTLTTAFTFQDGKLVSQEVINKEYVDRKTH